MTRRDVLASGAALLATPGYARPGRDFPGVRLVPDQEAMVAVPGGRVYVRVNGDLKGPCPPLVLMHGGPGSSHWYFLNATALAGDRAVILYDQLDCGRSDAPGDPANWVIPRFLDELEAIRGHFAIPRWHVLGASWGGTLCVEYGARMFAAQPGVIASLIVQSPLVSTPLWLRDARLLKDRMPPDVRDRLDRCDVPGALPQAECDAATDAFYARHVHLSDPPPAIAAYKKTMPRSFSPNLYNYMWGRAEFTSSGTLKDYDGTPLLQKLEAKRTLFVAGEADEAVPATVAGFAAAVPGGAAFREIPDAAHAVMGDNPAAYLAVLRPWLAGRD